MTLNFNYGIEQIDCKSSFYVGDADARLVGDTTNPWQGQLTASFCDRTLTSS